MTTATLTATLLAAALSAGSGASAPATTSSEPGAAGAKDGLMRAQVDANLQSVVAVPAERWQSLGPPAVPFLVEVASDPDAFPGRRVKAIHALAVVGSESNAQLLLDLTRSESEPHEVRLAALRDAVLLLPSKKAFAATAQTVKGVRSIRIRAAAAETLTRLSRGEGCAAVRIQVEKEKPGDRGHFQGALDRCPKPAEPTAAAPTKPVDALASAPAPAKAQAAGASQAPAPPLAKAPAAPAAASPAEGR